jgi:hypothetical protein
MTIVKLRKIDLQIADYQIIGNIFNAHETLKITQLTPFFFV